jgi:CRP-like cAMP-binding protein
MVKRDTSLTRLEPVLAGIGLFKGLSDQRRRELAEICGVVSIAKGEELFFEGQQADRLFILLKGDLQLSKFSHEGKESVMCTIWPGDLFAEVVLFERNTYPVTATALNACDICGIPRAAFMRLLDDAGFRQEFITGLMQKLRYLTQRLHAVTALNVEHRFFWYLTQQFGCKPEYSITMSKKALAAAIEATPETFSRLTAKLRKAGKITWRGTKLTVAPQVWKELSEMGIGSGAPAK